MHGFPFRLDRLGVKVDGNQPGLDHRLAVPLGPPNDRVNAGDQFFAVEGFGQIVIRAEPKAFQLVFRVIRARQNQDRGFDPGLADLAQNLMPAHVRQVQVKQDQIVIVKLCQIDPVFAHIGAIDVQVGMGQHQFDRTRGRRIVFHKQNAHLSVSPPRNFSSLTEWARNG